MPRIVIRAAMNGAKRAKRDRRQRRALAHGRDRRDPCRADSGQQPGEEVIRTRPPGSTTTVRPAKTVPAVRKLEPDGLSTALSPFARPSPRNRPTTDAIVPITSASRITDVSTCRREAPIVRRVANSRTRWATVIESVLKITKAPTKSAMPPNASRK